MEADAHVHQPHQLRVVSGSLAARQLTVVKTFVELLVPKLPLSLPSFLPGSLKLCHWRKRASKYTWARAKYSYLIRL